MIASTSKTALRFQNESLQVLILQGDRYVESDRSRCLPDVFVVASLLPFLARRTEISSA